MVRTNIQTFSGEVEILSNLHVGSNLVANDTASNVLSVTGAIGANIFIGDGGLLSNIATTLGKIVDQGNTVANVVQFSSSAGYNGVGIVTDSNVGIQNTNPAHTLSIGDKVYFDDTTNEALGESVMVVDGRINATRFEGDGGLLSNIATTLQSIVNQGNVSVNVVRFSSNAEITDFRGTGLVTDSNVGIQNTYPLHNLSVGSNLFVDDVGSNVLTIIGDAHMSNLNLGQFTVVASYGLDDVTATSNGTTQVVQFQNTTTSLVADSNIVAAGNVTALQLISTANTEVGDRLKFSGSNVYIDTLRVADVASNLVTYDRATGELTDSGGTFSNKFAVVSKQPPSVLSANATTVTNHGTYTLTTSNLATNSNTFNAFDGTATGWVSSENYNGGGGGTVFHENNLTQLSNLHPTQFGDWLAVEFPYKTTLRHMKLTPLTAAQYPTSANLYATNNDLTWSEIKYWKDVDPVTDSNVQTIVVNATEQFKKYALVATKARGPSGSAANVAIQDWQLFTESFSIDGGKVAMAQQAATGGETVMDQSGPHGRLPKTVPLKKYPEIAFESGKFDYNDSTNTYVQAGYTVSASSQDYRSSRSPWCAFDDNDFTHQEFNAAVHLYDGGNGTNPGFATTNAAETTNVDGSGTYRGEWLQIELPNKIKLNKYVLGKRANNIAGIMPKEAKILGSNDGTNWTTVYDHNDTGGVYSTSLTVVEKRNFQVNSSSYYKYFRLATNKLFPTGLNNDNTMTPNIAEWSLYGYEEDPPAGDTSVDTTFTSIMNTPQTTGANVYVDAKLSSDFTNRVVGPIVSNTHTTYVSAGKYWELSGNVESNVTVEANTFLSGDAPHSVSVWFNSSNLESNVSNSCIFSLNSGEERFDHIGAVVSNNYQTVQRLLTSDIAAGDRFGSVQNGIAISSDGTKMIVGAYQEEAGDTSDAGAAYIFTYSNGSWNETTKLVSPNIEVDAHFGVSVAMNSDGTKVIVTADGETVGGLNDAGAAYIFTYSNGSWGTGTQIVAPDKAADDIFGYSVAMSGDGNTVIVGAHQEDEDENGQNTLSSAGSAYIFTYSNGSWSTGTKIVASNRSVDADFGRSVAINNDGTMVIVGASTGDSSTTTDTGSAYIFTYSNGSWSETKLLEASDGVAVDTFGYDVAMSSDGTKVIVGAWAQDPSSLSSAGAAYIFTYSNGSWDTGTKIVASDKEAGDRFGISVGMNPDGSKVVVGAYLENPAGVGDAGAAYIYNYDGSNWGAGTKIIAPDGAANDYFGRSVAINNDGTKVIVGAYLADAGGTDSGAAYIFTRDTTHYLTTDLKLQSNTWHNLTYAYQGEGGSRVTYLDGRKVSEDQAEDTFGDYPPFAMTGYSQGGYVVSVSSTHTNSTTDYLGWYAFNSSTTTGSALGWVSLDPVYTGSSYTAADPRNLGTDYGGAATVNGEYIILEMPHSLRVNYVKITHRKGNNDRSPASGRFYGSNDGINWEEIKQFSGITAADYTAGPVTIIINSNKSYKKVALVATGIPKQTADWVGIGNLEYYGHRENDLVRLPDPTNVLKYPHIAMTGPAQRGYVASASDFNTSYPAWEAFDDKYTDISSISTPSPHALNRWQPTGGYANTGTPRNADGTETTTLASGSSPSTYAGEWLQLESPNKVNVKSYRVYNSTDYVTDYNAHTVVMLGSNTGVNDWVDIGSGETVLSWSPNTSTADGNHVSTVAIVNTSGNTGFYKYHRLVVRKVTDESVPVIYQLQLFGTEEATPIPIQIGGGNIDRVANFRVYDKFIGEDQALEIWDAQKDEFGRAKSSMTLQKGRLGIGTTEPEGRLAVADEPHNLEEFPPRALTGYKTHIEGHGEFCVSESSYFNSGYEGWRVFDKYTNSNVTNDPTGRWTAGGNTSTIGSLTGKWVKLELPYRVNFSKIGIFPPSYIGGSAQCPTGFSIIVSNDNETWTSIKTLSNYTWTEFTYNYITFENDGYFKYIAVVATTNGGNPYTSFQEIRYFGTREQGQSVLHDGQLTLTKNLTVPRIGPPLDADDTPRRDRLVVEYNTSTNPTFEGVVRDTSGRGNDGVLGSGVSYDVSEKSLVLDNSTGGFIHRDFGSQISGNFIHSISLWVKGDTFATGNIDVILWIGDNVDNKRVEIYASTTSISYNFKNNNYNSSNSVGLEDGVWNHVAFTYNGQTGSTGREIYVNGKVIAASHSGNADALNITNGNLYIGSGATPGNGYDFDGSISNFKLYNTALTAEEVKTLYDMGRCDEGHHVVNFSKTRVRGLISNDTVEMAEIVIANPAEPSTRGIYSNDNATRLHWAKGVHDFEWGSPGNGFFYIRYNGAERGYFYHDTGNFGQIDFTGQHRSFIDAIPQNMHSQYVGMIVCANKNKYYDLSSNTIITGNKAINVSEALPLVSLSNVALDKTCYGVISNTEYGEIKNREYEMGTFVSVSEKPEGDNRAIVNSVGEGAIWVVNTNGSLESGDYITTSNVAGYGQKQDDDILHNYTVAKITMDCDFNPATQPVQQILRSNVVETYYLGNVHHTKTVPHEFVTTIVTADDAWSNVSISPSDTTYAEWSNLEANTQNTYTLTYTQTSNVVYDTKYTLTTTANVTESDSWNRVYVYPPTVTYAEWSNLEANTQNTYTLTFTQTTTDEKTPEEWSALESNTQSLYNKVYYQSVEEEVAATWPGAVAHTRVTDRIENELDEHGQIQWEDHPTDTEKAYKIRYLDANGVETDSANAVHIAAFVGCTYHCG